MFTLRISCYEISELSLHSVKWVQTDTGEQENSKINMMILITETEP
jgi:hypothetical protein